MTIQELLQLAFEAGTSFGRKPFSHIERDAVDFKKWLEINKVEVEKILTTERQMGFDMAIDPSNWA